MNEKSGVKISVTGRVQGVWFRAFTRNKAVALDITGWVRNEIDGSVYLEAEGTRKNIETLIQQLHKGSLGSRVDQVQVDWFPYENQFNGFEIRY